MYVRHFFLGFILGISLLALSTLLLGCYTQFSTSDWVERKSTPSEVDVRDLVDSGANVTINNYYYDVYYTRFLRPTIYGFGSVWWGWYDPFWDYPLWYTPAVVYYGWGVWGWNRWGWVSPVLPYWGSGSVTVVAPTGTRRTGIGRMRLWSRSENMFAPLPMRYGTSSGVPDAMSSYRRQHEGSTSLPTDASRRSNIDRAAERQTSGAKESYPLPSRRQASGEHRIPSYSAPSQRSAPPAVSPSHQREGGSYRVSPSGTSGRRQR